MSYRRNKRNNLRLLLIGFLVFFILLIAGLFWRGLVPTSTQGLIELLTKAQAQLNGMITGVRNDLSGENEIAEPKSSSPIILRLGVVSDSHGASANLERAIGQMKMVPVDYILHLGDFTEGGEAEQLVEAGKILSESGIPFYVLPGDHDFNWFPNYDRTNFEAVFGMQYDQIVQTPVGVSMIMFENSIQASNSADELDWLRQVITVDQESGNWQIVFSARPFFSPYFPAKEDQTGTSAVSLLTEMGVGFAFAGDTHVFARYKSLDEKIEFVTVGAVGEYKNPLPQWVLVEVHADKTLTITPKPIIDFTGT